MTVVERTAATAPADSRHRRWRRVVAAAVVVLVVVLGGLVVRDVSRPAVAFGSSWSRLGGGAYYSPPIWAAGSDVYLVNLPTRTVATFTFEITNPTGRPVTLDAVGTALDGLQPTPAAELSPLSGPAGFDPHEPWRPAVGATLPAGGRAALRVAIRGRGCHGATWTGAGLVDVVTVGYRRLGIHRSVEVRLPVQLTVIEGTTLADDSSCGLPGLRRS